MIKSDVSFLRRLGAIVYDVFLSFSLTFFIIGMVLIAFFDKQAQPTLLIFVLMIVCVYFYFTWSWVKGGQTLGMKAWNIEILQHNGNKITGQQAFRRFVFSSGSWLLVGLGFIYQLFNQDNLTLHDKLSNTYLRQIEKTKNN